MNTSLADRCYAALNHLTKWRSVFTGWQLGTRLNDDPECQAVRDHREVTILLRVESNALITLLLDKGIFTTDEWHQTVIKEVGVLEEYYEARFPGMKATDDGMQFDRRAVETMKNWKP